MKLELDMWRCLPDRYTKFEIDISKHVEKKPRKLRKIQKHKNTSQNSKNKIFAKLELMSRSVQQSTYVPNLKDLSWFMRPWLQKNKFWPTLGYKVGQIDPIAMKVKLNMSCHLLNVYAIIPSFKLISQSMLIKSPENSDGGTDGRTLTLHNTTVFQMGV